jgi:hypothetical protein
MRVYSAQSDGEGAMAVAFSGIEARGTTLGDLLPNVEPGERAVSH